MSVGLSITLSQDILASNFVCSPIVGTIDADVTSDEFRWSGPSCSNWRTVPQQERCPRRGKFFCRWSRKIEQIGADLRKQKTKIKLQALHNSKFSVDLKKRKKKGYRAKLVWSA